MLVAPDAWAFDAEVRSDTTYQGYQSQGPEGTPVLTFRRLTESITLNGVSRPSDRRGITWTLRIRLRVDTDFGDACSPTSGHCLDELNQSRVAEFEPLAALRTVDMPYAYMDGSGFFRGAADVRLGRQFIIDPMGYFLFDGARVRVHVATGVSLEAYSGLETREGSPLASGRYERDGLIRADRTGWDPTLAPQVLAPAMAGTVGATAEYTSDPLLLRAAWREVWTAVGTSEEKVGGSADLNVSRRFRVFSDAVYSVPQSTLTNLTAGAEWHGLHGGLVGGEFARYRPSFDLNSVWASFWTDPTDDLRLHAELPIVRGLTVVGSGLVRRYALSEAESTPGVPALADEWATGGGLGLLFRNSRWDVSLRGHAEGGSLGSRAGGDLLSHVWLLMRDLRLDTGVSGWTVTDTERSDRDLTSLGLMARLFIRVGHVASIHLDVEDDLNHLVGQRFRAMSILDLRTPQ